MTSRKTKPTGALVISTFQKLEDYANGFAKGHFNLLIIVGGAGLAKSQTVKKSVGDKALWIEGSASALVFIRNSINTEENRLISMTLMGSMQIRLLSGYSSNYAKPTLRKMSPGLPTLLGMEKMYPGPLRPPAQQS